MIDLNFIYSVKYSDGAGKWQEILLSYFKSAKPNKQLLKQIMTSIKCDAGYDALFAKDVSTCTHSVRLVVAQSIWFIALKIVGSQIDKAKMAADWLKRMIKVMDPFGASVDKAEYIKALIQYVIDEYKLIDILEDKE